jgi:hypothetical protein
VAGVTANDRFRFYLYESPVRNVLVTSARLDSTSTSVLIPANKLKPGQNYQGMLFFVKAAVPGDTTGIPPALLEDFRSLTNGLHSGMSCAHVST